MTIYNDHGPFLDTYVDINEATLITPSVLCLLVASLHISHGECVLEVNFQTN